MIGPELSIRLLLFCAVIAAAGAAVTGYGVWLGRASEASRDWPVVTGQLLHAQLALKDQDRLSQPKRQQVKPENPIYRTVRVWDLDVAYRYRVGDREYTGSTATSTLLAEDAADDVRGPGESLRAAAARLRPGPVPVHYDPEQPDRSFLIHVPDPQAPHTVRFGLWMVAGAVAVALLLVLLKRP